MHRFAKHFIYTVVVVVLLSSCAGKGGENLPPATGLSGDMYLIMDSIQYKGPLGKVIDSLFSLEVQGLPRKESIYHMRWIDPRKLNFILKQRRNLIYAVTLDQHTRGAKVIQNLFTKESIEKIKSDDNFFVRSTSNVYAQGQEVMYLFGNTTAQLVKNIRDHGAQLISHFDRREEERLMAAFSKSGRVKGASEWLQKNLQCDMVVPFGYRIVINNDDFFWVRQINPKDDKDIFIARTDYTSKDQFKKENLIQFRDEVCKKYLFEDPDVLDSYLLTETTVPFIPVTATETTLNDRYAVQLKGLWRANNFSMGGPFVGFAMADEKRGEFYYIEGFTFSPSRDQREIMRELESLLDSFHIIEGTATP